MPLAAQNHKRLRIKHLIQKQPLGRRRDDAVGALFGFEDFGDVVGREAPAPDGMKRTGQATHHTVKKATALGIETQVLALLLEC